MRLHLRLHPTRTERLRTGGGSRAGRGQEINEVRNFVAANGARSPVCIVLESRSSAYSLSSSARAPEKKKTAPFTAAALAWAFPANKKKNAPRCDITATQAPWCCGILNGSLVVCRKVTAHVPEHRGHGLAHLSARSPHKQLSFGVSQTWVQAALYLPIVAVGGEGRSGIGSDRIHHSSVRQLNHAPNSHDSPHDSTNCRPQFARKHASGVRETRW